MRLEIHSMDNYKEFKESKFYQSGFHLHNSNTPPQEINSNISRNRSKYQDYLEAKQLNCETSELIL